MTEAEWLKCLDFTQMIAHLQLKGISFSQRKERLVWCAFCRNFSRKCIGIPQSLLDVLEVAEQDTDNPRTQDDIREAVNLASRIWEDSVGKIRRLADLARIACDGDLFGTIVAEDQEEWNNLVDNLQIHYTDSVPSSVQSEKEIEDGKVFSHLIREIYGNPFSVTTINPAWLGWEKGVIRVMAQAIYDDCVFDQMPILADALEDAGCTNVHILAHCRESGIHARGCWVLDLLLGRE